MVLEKASSKIVAFKEFIDKHVDRLDKNDHKCNVFDISLGNWYVPQEVADTFLERYDAIIKDGQLMHTYEHSNDVRGLMVDFDVYQSKNIEYYPNHLLSALAEEIYLDITESLCTTGKDNNYTDRVIITRKPNIEILAKQHEGDCNYKDGFHISFPSMRVSKELRVHLLTGIKDRIHTIMEEAINRTGDSNLIDNRDLLFSASNMDEWIDLHAAYVNPMLHGSQKSNADKAPHKIVSTGIITALLGRRGITVKTAPTEFQHIGGSTAMVLCHSKYPCNFYEVDPNVSLIKHDTAREIYEQEREEDELNIEAVSIMNPKAAYLKKLLELLPSEYYEDYHSWFRVLCALSSVGDRFKCIGKWFSKKSKKYSESEFDRQWYACLSGAHKKRLTERSIIYWAHKADPIRFQEITATTYYKLLIDTIIFSGGELNHGQHAKLLYSMLAHKYVFSSKVDARASRVSEECWYEFIMPEDHHKYGEVYKWRADPKAMTLKKYIIENYPTALEEGRKYIADELNKLNPDDDKEKFNNWSSIFKNFKRTVKNIGTIQSVESIVRMCELFFERKTFAEELDKEPQIIGTANGILKVSSKCKLIERHHEHPIMIHTVAAYHPYDATSEAVKKVRQIFSQVYPCPETCDYIWYLASTGLDRRPVTGKMLFIIGAGANGKTATMNFIQNALGLDLCATINMSLLTGQTGKSNEADSAFMQAKGKTILMIDEGSAGDIMNSRRIKNLVNNNKQTGRELFKAQENFSITACSMVASNHWPLFRADDTDYGLWRRVLFTEVTSKFTDNPDPNRPNEFKIDPRIEDEYIKDPLYLNATLSIMAYYYENFMTKYQGKIGNVPHEAIAERTREFRKKQDRTFRYCCERIIVSPTSIVGASDLGSDYSSWSAVQFRDYIVASNAEEHLCNGSLGEFKSCYEYIGIRLKTALNSQINKAQNEMYFNDYISLTAEQKKKYNDDAAELRKKNVEPEYESDIEV